MPPVSKGSLTAVFSPTFAFHSGLTLERWFVKMKVVPEPSARRTAAMGASGKASALVIFCSNAADKQCDSLCCLKGE